MFSQIVRIYHCYSNKALATLSFLGAQPNGRPRIGDCCRSYFEPAHNYSSLWFSSDYCLKMACLEDMFQ